MERAFQPIARPPNGGIPIEDTDGQILGYRPAESIDQLFNYLQTFARENGFAVIRRQASNYRDFGDGVKKASRYTICCDRDSIRASESVGLRQTATQKINCPWRGIAAARKDDDWKWTFRHWDGEHNHGPSADISAHSAHRKLTDAQKEIVKNASRHPAIPARAVAALAREAEPGSVLKQKDVDNQRQRFRLDELNGRTPTQTFLHILETGGALYRVKFAEDDPDRVLGLFWTFQECQEKWRRFPEALSLDNTYKTNRYKLPLMQVTGLTNINSVFNVAWGLIDNERFEGFSWLLQQLEDFRKNLKIPDPYVMITDNETALKDAIATWFPQVQQQLCIFHINMNLVKAVKGKWQDSSTPDEGSSGIQDESECHHVQFLNRNISVDFNGELPPVPVTREGFIEAWRYIAFAADRELFMRNWAKLIDTFRDQEEVLIYIQDNLMPVREQWAKCYIDHYRNFGLRVTSGTESTHYSLKQFLITGRSDLYGIYLGITEMVKERERIYTERVASQEVKMRRQYLHRRWLGQLPTQITYHAIDLLARQHRIALVAVPTERNPHPPPLRACTNRFKQQYGLPCSHTILPLLLQKKALEKEDVHPRWWLEVPLVRAQRPCSNVY